MTYNESLGKICIEEAVFYPSKAEWPKGSPFLEGPKLNKQEVGIPAWDVLCRKQVGVGGGDGGREKGDLTGRRLKMEALDWVLTGLFCS